MKIIEVIIHPDGSSQVETKGFQGSNCQQASRFVEQALGARLTERTTPEFFHEEVQDSLQLRSP
jgi:hypothetical protein